MIVKVEMVGTLPLIHHAQGAMQIKNPLAKRYHILTKKRGKTDEEMEELAEMEFELGLYWNSEDACVCFPIINIIRCIQDGGKKVRLGTKVIQSIRWDPKLQNVPLIYPGHEKVKSIKDLLLNDTYMDTRTVVVTGRVHRTRPIFRTWSLRPTLFLESEMTMEELQICLDWSGRVEGLGDFRIGTKNGGFYGTFTATCKEHN